MSTDLEPCLRCGVLRTARVDGNRSGYCRDCKGHANKSRPDRNWMDDAACAQVDPELFFPSSDDDWQPTRAAKQICAQCPVAAMCLADTPSWDRWSIRGGMTGRERRTRKAA